MRDTVEVGFQVGVHHKGVPGLDQPIDFPQRFLAAPSRTKAIARRQKLDFKDRFDHELHRRLHDAVLDRRNAQRPRLPSPFGISTRLTGCGQ